MALRVQSTTPGTLADVIQQVVDAFSAMGNATPIQVGAHYMRHFGVGSAPTVLFIPDVSGSIGPPQEMGAAASVSHGCRVVVAAGEGSTDVDRFRAVYALADLVIDCLSTACAGRIVWGAWADVSPTTADAFGAAMAFAFVYRRDVPHASARWRLPAASTSTLVPRAALPDNRGGTGALDGERGTVDAVTPTTDVQTP